MNLSPRLEPFSRFAALISLIIVNARLCCAETSGEYLQKAMVELQQLNVPSNSVTMHDRLSVNHYQYAGYKGDYNQDNAHRKLSTNNAYQDIRHQEKPIATNALAEQAQSAGNNIVQYYAIRDPAPTASYPKVKQPEPLVPSRAKLAALYKQALEKGSAISVAALTQALNAAGGNGNEIPQVGHLPLPIKYPLYNYYFFPLKTFASELQDSQGDPPHHQAMIAPMFAATETVESTQKQLMNPLFVAIGTFISMALLFMMGVLFLPKLPHIDLFNARVADNDDFLRLTTFVMNAIDGRNRRRNFSKASYQFSLYLCASRQEEI